ncbi:MAG: triose-phosphate isomerase [Holosporaceae bacterium]|jgi:triosephosphate isomerase|nr:triose-phosphate isomerase [Holosporaceae bacterium]
MKIIVANWKMNGGFAFADRFIKEMNAVVSPQTIVVCPPAILIGRFSGFKHSLGAQNCFWEERGAFTGENSPKLLREAGCDYVILGHSERRSIFGEDNGMIYRKWMAALAHGLIPIVCVGEKFDNRYECEEVISDQLALFLDGPKLLANTIFAYEPVWSVGTGITPTPDEIVEIFAFLKEKVGDAALLLYGGSVNAKNAKDILNCEYVDGVLVGGASLKIDEFKKIVDAV